MNTVPQHQSDMLGDFMKGAMQGIIGTTLAMGFVALMFMGAAQVVPLINVALPALNLAMPAVDLLGAGHLASTIGLILAGGMTTGTLRAYRGARVNHHMQQGDTREANIIQSTPTIIPLLGMDHGTTMDTMDIEPHHHGQQRNWRETHGQRGGDRVQEILNNRAISDKDRAAAILAEREARAATPQTQSL